MDGRKSLVPIDAFSRRWLRTYPEDYSRHYGNVFYAIEHRGLSYSVTSTYDPTLQRYRHDAVVGGGRACDHPSKYAAVVAAYLAELETHFQRSLN